MFFTFNFHIQLIYPILITMLQFAQYNTGGELTELKNHEIEEITNYCRKCFEEQQSSYEKRKSRFFHSK